MGVVRDGAAAGVAGRGRGCGWWSGYSHYSRGTATTVGVLPRRSGSTNGRGPGRVVRGASLARRGLGRGIGGGLGRGLGRGRGWGWGRGSPDTFSPTPTRQRSAAHDPTGTPTVGRPRQSWQCPDCGSSTPTVVAVPRLLPATKTPTTATVTVTVTDKDSRPFQRRAYTRTQSTSICAGKRVVRSGDPRKRPPTARFITR